MQDRLFKRIEAIWNHQVDEVLGDEVGVAGLSLSSTVDGGKRQLDVHGLFVAIGHTPNTSLFEGKLAMHDGYLIVQGGLNGDAGKFLGS